MMQLSDYSKAGIYCDPISGQHYRLTCDEEYDPLPDKRGTIPDHDGRTPFDDWSNCNNPHWFIWADNPGKFRQAFFPLAEPRTPPPEDNIISLHGGPVIPEKTSFSDALEQAFWLEGGISLLQKVARLEPVEFVKLCAKLIPKEIAENNKGDVHVTIIEERPINKEGEITSD